MRGIGGRSGGLFLLSTENYCEDSNDDSYDYDADENRTQAGLLPLSRGTSILLEQAIHGRIVLLALFPTPTTGLGYRAVIPLTR